jgi:hypothetical protein
MISSKRRCSASHAAPADAAWLAAQRQFRSPGTWTTGSSVDEQSDTIVACTVVSTAIVVTVVTDAADSIDAPGGAFTDDAIRG